MAERAAGEFALTGLKWECIMKCSVQEEKRRFYGQEKGICSKKRE